MATASSQLRVREIHLKKALDLFDVLAPGTLLFENAIFRGQASADWGLIPAAFRDGIPWLLPEQEFPSDKRVYGAQVKAEIELLWLFSARANEAGLLLPGDSEGLRHTLEDIRSDRYWVMNRNNLRAWPPRNMIPWLALAQHHGVPTRLLDWTFMPFAAMYFAAEGVCRADVKSTPMAVWVCSLEQNRQRVLGAPSIEIERPSNAYNPNLRAQRGCLMVWRNGASCDQSFERVGLEVVLSKEADRARVERPTIFTKLTLPSAEAANVLQLLSLHQVDGSTLFPGFDGIARVVRERQYWDGFRESLGADFRGELNKRKQAVARRLEKFLKSKQHLLDWQQVSGEQPRTISDWVVSLQERVEAGDYFPEPDKVAETVRELLSEKDLDLDVRSCAERVLENLGEMLTISREPTRSH